MTRHTQIALLQKAALEIQKRGLWAVTTPERLRAAHYFERPGLDPTYAESPPNEYRAPLWEIRYRNRIVRVQGFPMEMICTDDAESGAMFSGNRRLAERWCHEGWVYLGDFSRIRPNRGRWTADTDPRWIFENEVEAWCGRGNPDGIMQFKDDLSDAVRSLLHYNFDDIKTA